MNESLGRPSNLTQKQQREALEAIYGLTMTPTPELTYEERIKMRRYLDQLDQKESGSMKTFDLNKPPQDPYVYREYPILLYKHATGENKPAYDYEQRQRMLADGWSENPKREAAPAVVDDLTEDERREAEAMDKQLKKRSTK
jgi:hypothetical protein